MPVERGPRAGVAGERYGARMGGVNLFQAFRRLVTVPNDNPELTLAQFKAFSKQVPLLYFILLTNMLSLAGTHQQSAPFWLVKVVPLVFGVVFVVRAIGWIRESRKTVDAAYAYRRLVATNRLVLPISVLSVAWSAALVPYGNDYQRAHVAFFMSITVIGVIFCLMHLRSAALMVTFLVILPFSAIMGLSGEPTLIATAVNMFLVSLAMIAIMLRHYADFTKLNEQRLTLLAQQAALQDKNRAMQALSDENLGSPISIVSPGSPTAAASFPISPQPSRTPARGKGGLPSGSSIWMASSRSTTFMATPPATRFWSKWRGVCRRSRNMAAGSFAWAATNSPC